MCHECNWVDTKGLGYKIRERCDCGNQKWSRGWVENKNLREEALFRCTKCDSLQYAAPNHVPSAPVNQSVLG